MLILLPLTHGNRRRDTFGNCHTALDQWGSPVFRSPGRYRGRHRR